MAGIHFQQSNPSNQNTMKTYPHLQQNATPEKPFYSVCYQYTQNPWTLWSHTHYKGSFKGTQSGTSSFEVAKAQAEKLVAQPGIEYAQVSKTEDCYNHTTVFEIRRAKP